MRVKLKTLRIQLGFVIIVLSYILSRYKDVKLTSGYPRLTNNFFPGVDLEE